MASVFWRLVTRASCGGLFSSKAAAISCNIGGGVN